MPREESDVEVEPPEQFHVPFEEDDEVILNQPVNVEEEGLPPLQGEEQEEADELRMLKSRIWNPRVT